MPTNSRLSTDEPNTARWRLLIRALHSRNYRLFFEGQVVSLIGTWMTRVATSWLVYRLTGSAFLLGLTSFASQIPILFLTPFAGVWVDRWDRHRTLVVTQILAMLQSFALAALALAGLNVAEYAANLVKKTVVGVGHAEKPQVAMMVRMLLPASEARTPDAADALAVAICHAQHRNARLRGAA